jgi:serine/threonine protein kinase
MSLADSLRKLHDAGKAHGAVTPSSITVTGTGLDLIPSLGPPATVTPYTAPETLQGMPADARSDIFAFGALFFEMLTGRRAFDGNGQTALTMALVNSDPPSSGSSAVDRLVSGCVAKSPAARWQRMQKIIMELKLLTVAARRADAQSAPRGPSGAAVRAEIQQLEGRLNARLAASEKTVAETQQAAGAAVNALREQVAELNSQLAGLSFQLADVKKVPAHPPLDVDSLIRQIAAGVGETVEAVSQRMTRTEQSTEEIRQHFSTLQENIASDLHDFERTLKAQAGAIESARTAMAQTDDLVERVVEALELLQSSVLDSHEELPVSN